MKYGDLVSKQAVLDAIQKLNIPEDMCVFEIISHIEVAIATLPSIENKGDLISRERLINEWDDLGRRYAMPTTPIHKRAFREFPSADMRGTADD